MNDTQLIQRWAGVAQDGVYGPATAAAIIAKAGIERPTFDRAAFSASLMNKSADAITEADYERAAQKLGAEVAAVKAVAEVESGPKSYDRLGRPVILFERHKFSQHTGRKYNRSHPHISANKWGGYSGGAAEYDRLAAAAALDLEAALKSASWGKFQILGENYKMCGFDSVQAFVDAMVEGEAGHLDAFVGFVQSAGLAPHLRAKNWKKFARGYNGPLYWKNRYAKKMADAYRRHSA